MTDQQPSHQTGLPKGLTFAELGELARRLASGFPTSIPALSEIEAAGLVGALRVLWSEEAARGR